VRSYTKKDFLVLFAAGNDGKNAFSKTVGSPATCKNCITVGATQLSDELFRGMKPLVDQGWHCKYSTAVGCCATNGGISCVQTSDTSSPCCTFTAATKMSLACCPTQYTCSVGSSGCPVAPSVNTGNIRSAYNVATFCSRGTTYDDARIKPDLVAPGEDILSANGPGAYSNGTLIATDPGHCVVPSPTAPRTKDDVHNFALRTMSGTSMATPLAAGAVEKIRQYFVQGYYPSGVAGGTSINPDESLLRAVILASAQPLSGSGGVWNLRPSQTGQYRFPIPSSSNIPDIFGGFGMPILDNAVTMSGGSYKMFYTNETFSTLSGASAFTIQCIIGSAIPVTLVLAWTDPPGFTSSKKQLVNDLDLIVLVPNGSPSQLFGNMRQFADQSNNVERTICACPAGGSITAIVVSGEALKTIDQTWYLVANGPISSAITKLGSVPSYSAGRITAPATTSTNCMSASRSINLLYFNSGQQWTGSASSWDMLLRFQEFSTSLSTYARVNGQAISISMPTSDGSVTLSLGCSNVISSYGVNGSQSYAYVTASELLNTIKNNCGLANSPCPRDPVLSAFNWTAFAVVAVPPPPPPPVIDACNSYASCFVCTAASACGWCPALGMCKSGASSSSTDSRCVASLSTWFWQSSRCSSVWSPPAPSPLISSFVFRLDGWSLSSWTSSDTSTFESGMKSLIKDPATLVKVTGVRSGSVVLDTQVSTASASQLSAVNAIFTNPAEIQKVPLYGSSMSVAAVGSSFVCSGYTTSATCVAAGSSGCGWCSKVASCLPGSKQNATVPAGSFSTCSGSDWQFSDSDQIDPSCASSYLVVGASCA
jgi:hypothetical protein